MSHAATNAPKDEAIGPPDAESVSTSRGASEDAVSRPEFVIYIPPAKAYGTRIQQWQRGMTKPGCNRFMYPQGRHLCRLFQTAAASSAACGISFGIDEQIEQKS